MHPVFSIGCIASIVSQSTGLATTHQDLMLGEFFVV